MSQITTLLAKTKIDPSWSFSDKTRKDTAYITHGYHRYPAKFIPQIVSRLAEKYTRDGDFVVDINPVAVLITKAKITPIDPVKIEKAFTAIKNRLETYSEKTRVKATEHERIDYWFKPEEKRTLAFIFAEISKIKDQDIQDFFFCGFSNILKNCSIWLQKSNKPTRDFEKKPSEPIKTFLKQIKMMLRGNTRL